MMASIKVNSTAIIVACVVKSSFMAPPQLLAFKISVKSDYRVKNHFQEVILASSEG
tara:strand:+ start:99 stop:266 length:168 start_codon:yes stop_codon:yes gene_type:complete